jgi:hypothetical protein
VTRGLFSCPLAAWPPTGGRSGRWPLRSSLTGVRARSLRCSRPPSAPPPSGGLGSVAQRAWRPIRASAAGRRCRRSRPQGQPAVEAVADRPLSRRPGHGAGEAVADRPLSRRPGHGAGEAVADGPSVTPAGTRSRRGGRRSPVVTPAGTQSAGSRLRPAALICPCNAPDRPPEDGYGPTLTSIV